MRPVLFIQNTTEDAPGKLIPLLQQVGVSYRVINLDRNPHDTADPRQFSAVIALGGPDSANDNTQKMQTEHQLIRDTLEAKIPFLGVCLGLQIAVKVLGGKVVEAAVAEEGFTDLADKPFRVTITPQAVSETGQLDPLLIGLSTSFQVFESHSETVELTSDMDLLASGEGCRNQIVRFSSNTYGFQPHMELTRPMLKDWIASDGALRAHGEDKLWRDYDRFDEAFSLSGMLLLRNFLIIAGIGDTNHIPRYTSDGWSAAYRNRYR